MRRFITADVFTARRFAGNPLAVFPDASGLSDEQMQAIARELNLSETAFVLPARSAEATLRLRIFTPAVELPFAGHPTIGTAIVLALEGFIDASDGETRVVFEESVGPVPVTIVRSGDSITATLSAAQMPEYGPPAPPDHVLAALLGLDESEIVPRPAAPAAVSCGVPFLFVGLRTRDALRRAQLNASVWKDELRDSWAPHVFIVFQDSDGEHDLHARMFAPALNIPEDPATGGAATALAGWIEPPAPEEDRDRHWTIEQGRDMGRPSTIRVEAEIRGGFISAIRVSGTAVIVTRGTIDV